MKRILAAAVLALTWAACAQAQIVCLPPVKVDAGVKPWLKVWVGDVYRCGGQAYKSWGPNGPPGPGGPGGCGFGGCGAGGCGFGGCGAGGCGGPFPGPWYLFWPYEAHFQTPAPTPYPYYPAPQTLPTPSPQGGTESNAPAKDGSKGSGSGSGSGSAQGSLQTAAQPRIITDPAAVPSYWYKK